jgi:hypothetical protein
MLAWAAGDDLFQAVVIPHLTLAEAMRVEAACKTTMRISRLGDAWIACVRQEVRAFSLPAQPLPSDVQRRDFKKIVAALKRVGIAGVSPVILRSLKEAKDLESAINRMELKVARHAANGGHPAKVVVGAFSFSPAAAVLALVWPGATEDSHVPATIQPIMACWQKVQFGSSETPQAWKIGFRWQAGAGLYCRAEPVSASATVDVQGEASGKAIVIDIQAVSSDFVLRVQDMRLEAGGPWAKIRTGLCTALGTQAAAVEALARGLVCVLFVRAASGVPQASQSELLLLNALHLDMSGVRYAV